MNTPTLPKTATIEMQAHVSKYTDDGVTLFSCDMSEIGYVCLGPVTVTFDVPQVDVVAAQINGLEKVKAAIVEEYEHKLHKISEEIQNLRALTYSGEPA